MTESAGSPTATAEAEPRPDAGLPMFLQRAVAAYPAAGGDERGAPVRAGLTVGPPDDIYEREADRIADRIVGTADGGAPPEVRHVAEGVLQRACACEGTGSPCTACAAREEGVRRKEDGRALASEGGQALNAPARTFFEPRFERNLGNVRVHADETAAASAADLRARAYTRGDDIYFAAGQYRPDTHVGRRLIAHEIAHTIQQTRNTTPRVQRQPEAAATPPSMSTPPSPLTTFPAVGPETTAVRAPETTADPGHALMLARQVHQALDGWNEEAPALEALRGHGPAMRQTVQSAFQSEYGQALESYLIDQLDGDWRVNALALLQSPTEWADFAAIGRALLAGGIRDDDVLRLLYSRPDEGARQQLAREYDEAFAHLGAGSLVADINSQLSGWQRRKSFALLHRNLTAADGIYFDSVAIMGTHDEAVVDRVEGVWGEHGATGIHELIDDWARNLTHAHEPWVPEAFTSMDFRTAMQDELNGESFAIVDAHLTAQRRLAAIEAEVTTHLLATGEGPTEDQSRRREDIELEAANAILIAAADSAGTNEQQLQHAITEIRRIWEARLRRVRDSPGLLAAYTEQWRLRQEELLRSIPEEMDEGTVDHARTRLLLAGQLTAADRVYLADREGDNDQILRLATEAWAGGQIDELETDCERPHRAEIGRREVVVRPAFYLITAVPVSHGDWGSRLYPLLNDGSRIERGFRRLAVEINRGSSDADLQRARAFLTTEGLSQDIRNQVVAEFETRRLGHRAEEGPNRKFVAYVMERYERSHAAFALQDLLVPSSDPTELAERAEHRIRIERGIEIPAGLQRGALGVAPPVGIALLIADIDNLSRAIDFASGNDTEQATEESAARLRWIANAGLRNPEALLEVMRREGLDSAEQLASREYGLFEERFREWSELRTQVVETVATVIEIAVEIAIVAATGGGAAPLLLASIASTVAGIAVREAALGQNYDAASEENAQRLFMAAAAAGLGGGAHTLAEGLVDVQRLSRLGTFAYRATTDAIAQIGVQTLQLGFSTRYPTTEDIAAGALSILGSALGAGLGGATTRHAQGIVDDATRRARALIIAEAVQNLMQGIGQEGGELLRGGDLSAGEIIDRMARRALRDLAQGTLNGLREAHGAAHGTGAEETETDDVRSRRSRSDDDVVDAATGRGPRPEAGEGDETRRRAAEGAHDAVEGSASRRADGHEGHDAPRRALPPGEGVVAAARVNPDHTVSIVRTRDGRHFIVMCSDGCATLLTRLARARGTFHHEADLLMLDLLHAQVMDLEARMNAHPDDDGHAGALRELGDDIDDTIDWFRRMRRGAPRAGAPSSERGETYVSADAASRMLEEEGGEIRHYIPDPFIGRDTVAIGPSVERVAIGEGAQRAFLEHTLPMLELTHPELALQFHDAVRTSSVEHAGPPRYRWPVDTNGSWQVHHTLPLEWGGADDWSNYIAVPAGHHDAIHRMWNRVAARLRASTGGTGTRGGAEPDEQLEASGDPFE